MDNNIIQKGHPLYFKQNQVLSTYGTESDGTHYTMWSGGCDSTLLLYELIETYGSDNVVAISYNYPWLFKPKRESEVIYREAFKAKMKVRGKKYEIKRHLEFDININAITGQYEYASCMGLPQAVAWLLSIPLYAKENSYIYTGSIRSDDLTLAMDEYHQMFEGMSKTLHKDIHLREPYLYLTKADVIDKLFQYEIYDETWFCEMPDDVVSECYNCHPCRTHVAALTELSIKASSEFISLQAKNKLERIKEAMQHPKAYEEEITCETKKFQDNDKI